MFGNSLKAKHYVHGIIHSRQRFADHFHFKTALSV